MTLSERKPLILTWILLSVVTLLLLCTTTDVSFGRLPPPTVVPPISDGGGDEFPWATVPNQPEIDDTRDTKGESTAQSHDPKRLLKPHHCVCQDEGSALTSTLRSFWLVFRMRIL